ncbi:MAG: metallophosphoesterase family protein [Anaerolineae bacterium]|nr:metallophosphoesterase family protein [Anaerolineae bacterium]
MDRDDRMRLAVLSDVHGNAWALESVLADVERHRPHRFVLLGDLLADGPAPARTLALLRALPNATCVQGNTDRYLADLAQVVPPRSEMPDLIQTWRWAVDRLGEEGRRFLACLPTDAMLETPVGRVLATHGTPGNDEGLLYPGRADTWADLNWHGARLLLVGHTHPPFVLETEGGTIVNPGSVGIPTPTGWRASYALVDLFGGGQIAVRHEQVAWDIEAYIAAFEEGIPLNRKAAPMLEALRLQVDR